MTSSLPVLEKSLKNTHESLKRTIEESNLSTDEDFRVTQRIIEQDLAAIFKKDQEVQAKFTDGKANYIQVQLELREAKHNIEILKKALDKERQRVKELEESFEEREKQKLKDQKREFEAIIERNLQFIDQLVKDKKELNDQCTQLAEKFKELEETFSKQVLDLKEKHSRELKNSKEQWAAAEKLRKEKWVQEKTSEIKEITIRGLEPEIDRIMNKNKQEVKQMQQKHQEELIALREQLFQEYEEKMKAYKEKLARENEFELQRERDAAKQRWQEALGDLERKNFEEQERIRKNYERQFEYLQEQRNKDLERAEERIQRLKEDHKREIERLKEEK